MKKVSPGVVLSVVEVFPPKYYVQVEYFENILSCFKSSLFKALQMNPLLKKKKLTLNGLLVNLDFYAFMFKQIMALGSEVYIYLKV